MVEKDEEYWGEVRSAVGKGVPSVLLGTSTRSLRKALDRVRKQRDHTGRGRVTMSTPVPWVDIDSEIAAALHALADYGIDTFSSCQAGDGHPCTMPEILFHGDDAAGLYAIWLLEAQGFRVWELSRHWDLDHGLPRRPFWRVTLRSLEPMGPRPGTARVDGGGS